MGRGAILGAALSLAAGGMAQAQSPSAPNLAAMTPGELAAFMQAFPKGGELHNHLSGAVFGESLLEWAAEDGLCIDVEALAIVRSCDGPGRLKPAAEVIADEDLRGAMLDSLSVRKPGFRDRSGHDQFFTTFHRMVFAPVRNGDALAWAMAEMARQNTFYAELMVTVQGRQARAMGAQVGWKGDAAATRDALSAAGLEALVPAAKADTDAMEARAREVLGCATPTPNAGCQVTVRYLTQALRVGTAAEGMAQLQLGVALAAADPRWVGLQLVSPEDHPQSLANYDRHMEAVGLLTDKGRKLPAALHAGELTLAHATPRDMADHVAKAVRVAGARRIGHGVAMPFESGAEALAAQMARDGVLVEVNLSSNAAILGLGPQDHPMSWWKQRSVPISLSTDDAGILRIDPSGEYARAVTYGATYEDLKRSARNALAFSFLPGEGLWRDPNLYRQPASGCAGQIGADLPTGACATLVAGSDKAKAQWRHERLLKLFEAERRPPG